jgi:gluconolactonase
MVSHASLGCVIVLSHQGEPVARLRACRGPTVTNLVLREGRAFITESSTGAVMVADWP